MLEKEFVEYNEALALKELGFDEPCFDYYIPNKNNDPISKIFDNYELGKHNSNINTIYKNGIVSRPLYQQVFRWFRNKYNLNAPITDNGLGQYDFRINHNSLWSGRVWDTYEEAELECLKKLIEIVKTK